MKKKGTCRNGTKRSPECQQRAGKNRHYERPSESLAIVGWNSMIKYKHELVWACTRSPYHPWKVGPWIHIHWSGSRWMCLWLMTYHDLLDQISCLAHLLQLRHGLWGRFMSPSRGSPKKAPFIVIRFQQGVRGRCWMPKAFFVNLV